MLINVSKLKKSFGEFELFSEVSFSIDDKDKIGFIGINGAGKSTLLNILHGVYTEYEGTVKLHGKEVHFKNVNDAIVSGKISKVHQETLVVKDLTVGQNVTLGYEPKKGNFVEILAKSLSKNIVNIIHQSLVELDR